jgi:GntR family transcriptional repressor for pyruvate dehydrogenase complex
VTSYGVGRSSVREALRMLESRGLIQNRGNGTFAVADYRRPLDQSLDVLLAVDGVDYVELFEVRRILEGEAAALAAERRTTEHLEDMEAAVEDMVAGLGTEERFIEADLRFHLTVAAATGNRVLVHLMDAVRGLLLRSLASSYHIKGSPERAVKMHRQILAAVETGAATRARRRMQDHVAQVEGDIAATKRSRR